MAFIAFEGLDGSGKSTLIQGVQTELEKQGLSVQVTREPGGTELGDEIREMLIRLEGQAPTPRAELLLYEAGRAQHVDLVIRPCQKKNQWILCDRFSASTLAFQAGGRGLGESDIQWLNSFAVNGCEPDLWVLLDLPVQNSMDRLKKRSDINGAPVDRFEKEKVDFHERVRKTYLNLAKEDPKHWLILDARESPETLLEKLMVRLKEAKWLDS